MESGLRNAPEAEPENIDLEACKVKREAILT
jgi:hypothetical protein